MAAVSVASLVTAGRHAVSAVALDVVVRLTRAVRAPLEWWFVRSSLVPVAPFIDPGIFGWARDMEEHWADVRAELDAVLDADWLAWNGDALPFRVNPTTAGLWRTFSLFRHGARTENCDRFPLTEALLERTPGVSSASFSLLSPGTTIPPHRGPFGGVIRYHLGVIVPEPAEACGLRVGGQVRHWGEGESLLFDERYTHEAWNDTDRLRAVLFVDIVRPLRQPAATVNRVALKARVLFPHARYARRRRPPVAR
jgi:ornithine lipid ester-linked acyl 2-hydroxylase